MRGRKAEAALPPRALQVLGPIAAVSYLYGDPATLQGGTRMDRALCARYEPAIQRAYARMREAGAREAERLGRGVVFAAPTGAAAQAIPAPSINACCLPGGLIFVHSELVSSSSFARCSWLAVPSSRLCLGCDAARPAVEHLQNKHQRRRTCMSS